MHRTSAGIAPAPVPALDLVLVRGGVDGADGFRYLADGTGFLRKPCKSV
jgi:hypothetical protein